MRKFFLTALLLVTSVAFAALPPLRERERRWSSSDVVKGCIGELLMIENENSFGYIAEYTATVDVFEVVSGKNIVEGEVIYVNFNKYRFKNGRTGRTGQYRVPNEEQCGKFYMNKEPGTVNVYKLIEPNGWDKWIGPADKEL